MILLRSPERCSNPWIGTPTAEAISFSEFPSALRAEIWKHAITLWLTLHRFLTFAHGNCMLGIVLDVHLLSWSSVVMMLIVESAATPAVIAETLQRAVEEPRGLYFVLHRQQVVLLCRCVMTVDRQESAIMRIDCFRLTD